MRLTPLRRPGYTLLEMLLASAIAVMVFGALYTAVEYQMRLVQTGRDAVEQGLLARSVLLRMGRDVTLCVRPTTRTVSTTSAIATTVDPTDPASDPAAPMPQSLSFNRGLQGEANRLVLVVSRVPGELSENEDGSINRSIPQGRSDQRQVSYWLIGTAGNAQGLARRVTHAVTSDEAASTWDLPDDDPTLIIAEEVQSLEFRYFDGVSWVDSWDSTAVGATGIAQGPPAAVEIAIGVRTTAANPFNNTAAPLAGTNSDAELKRYVYRVAIPTANGPAQAATLTFEP